MSYHVDLALGLNLTACNNIVLVDLWWNPALEVRLSKLSKNEEVAKLVVGP